MSAETPTVTVLIDTPSFATSLGYIVFDAAVVASEFNNGKFAPSEIMVDRTSHVRKITTARGGSDATEPWFHAQAGTCSVVLNNRDRAYDPLASADVLPRRKIKIQATWAAVTYDLWTGYIDGWQLSYPGRSHIADAITTATGHDAIQFVADLNLATATFPSEHTGTRVRSVAQAALRQTSVDVAMAVDGGTAWMPAISQGSVSGLALVTEASDSELGEVYVARDGTFTFRDRTSIINDVRSSTSQVTFGDGGGTEIPFYDVTLSYDDHRIRNQISVVYNEANATVTKTDSHSLMKYGKKPYQVQVALKDATTAGELGQQLLTLYAQPQVRIDQIVLKPQRGAATSWPAVLSREIGDFVTVKVTPPGGGARISHDCWVRGVQHDITPRNEWTTTISLFDVNSLGISNYFRFDQSTFGGPNVFA